MSRPSFINGWRTPPVYGLFDFDPDGMGILSVYKYSSTTLEHETEDLKCSNMRWIGINSSDLLTVANHGDENDILSLSRRDRKRATGMLSREPLLEGGLEPTWRREVQVMLLLNIKAEIQVLQSHDSGLGSWIQQHVHGS